MFGLWNRKRPDVLKHWFTPLEDFQSDAEAFYAAIEEELKERRVPGLLVERVEFAEDGLLSAKRVYLRMTRERLVFDVCAAPFGTGFFFSCRYAEFPLVLRLWQVIVLLGLASALFFVYIHTFGPVAGSLICAGMLAGFLVLGRNVILLGYHNADVLLRRIPVIGPFYEVCLCKDTYYRQDTRLMYVELVDKIVQRQVEEFTAAKGIKQVTFNDVPPSQNMGLLNMLLSAFKLAR